MGNTEAHALNIKGGSLFSVSWTGTHLARLPTDLRHVIDSYYCSPWALSCPACSDTLVDRPSIKDRYAEKAITRIPLGEEHNPLAMTLDKSGNLVIGIGPKPSGVQRSEIHVFDRQGTFLRVMEFRLRITPRKFFDFKKEEVPPPLHMSPPMALAYDSDWNLIVVDSEVVSIFDPDGIRKFRFGGFGDKDGEFQEARGVAIDKSGNILISDWAAHRVQTFSPEGQYLRKFGFYGQAEGLLAGPFGLAVFVNGNIAVSERDNDRISIFSPTGKFLRTIGEQGKGQGKFWGPQGLAIDISGNLIVAEHSNNRVQIISETGHYLTDFSGVGQPRSVLIDRAGNIFALDPREKRILTFQ